MEEQYKINDLSIEAVAENLVAARKCLFLNNQLKEAIESDIKELEARMNSIKQLGS